MSGSRVGPTARPKASDGTANRVGRSAGIMNTADWTRDQRPEGHDDTGGASRYFPTFHYCTKASDRGVPGRPELTNKHPTHKHPDLMRWLIRLICPPGGLVLDCFGGSGTTGVAAQAEGVRCLLFERDPEHVEVARARIGSPVQVGLFA